MAFGHINKNTPKMGFGAFRSQNGFGAMLNKTNPQIDESLQITEAAISKKKLMIIADLIKDQKEVKTLFMRTEKKISGKEAAEKIEILVTELEYNKQNKALQDGNYFIFIPHEILVTVGLIK